MLSDNPTKNIVIGAIAVVIAILTALTAGSAASVERSGPASIWADPGHMLRTRLSPGNGSWWASGLPR